MMAEASRSMEYKTVHIVSISLITESYVNIFKMMQTAYAKTFNRSRGRVVSMYMGVVN
jgi:hypothetical protein